MEAREKLGVARQEVLRLQERTQELHQELRASGLPEAPAREASIQKAVNEHWVESAPNESAPSNLVTLDLAPEEHDTKMGELIGILQEYGVSAAIKAAEKSANPHLIDDFHRVLVEYVREGLPASGVEKKAYKQALSMSLYEVTLPNNEKETSQTDPQKGMRDFIALMEQFYRGMLQLSAQTGEHFSFEIANPAGSVETSIYMAVPKERKALLEKQLLSIFPMAQLRERHDDYNAFVEGAQVAAASAFLKEKHIYGLKTFDSFPNDPLDVMLNAFSKLDAKSEGAALQFVISPTDQGLLERYKHALERVKQGVPLHKATNVKTGVGRVFAEFGEFFSTTKKIDPDKRVGNEDSRIKNIEHKILSPLMHATIRLVTSAPTKERAEAILQDIEAPFGQFADTSGNQFGFTPVSVGGMKKFAHAFSYRTFEGTTFPLSCMELASLAHLPRQGVRAAAPELRQEKSQVAAPPIAGAQSGTLLGINRFRGSETKVFLQPEDRLRHFYLVGQTGTGKSALLKNMVVQDIRSGAGVCFLDPHGTDVLDILGAVPPERMQDVIYFDPAYTERPMGLNMLEYDLARPEQKTLVVDELLGIFKKLFGAVPESMGPAFEQYFRNAALLVMEDPASGNTLLDISRVFGDSEFRARKLEACKNPIVTRFWRDIAEQATGDQGLQNYAPYVTNKFDAFTTNEIVRPIIAQQTSAFNFRDIMDNKKILLVNLSKGRIGELNANLLGLVIVGKFLIAALSRADSFGKDLPSFYLHIDEFQNFATPSIATILSEARKYKLSLTVAHQFIAQLSEEIRDAVFGNVGSLCVFRIGADDAEFLEKQFTPQFTAQDLMRVDNFNAFVRLLVGGKPALPFNIETLPFEKSQVGNIERMQLLSYEKYGRPRAEIEQEIAERLQLNETVTA
ncbi:TraM recognition domain-containing protein [Candidatus Parcubacteria bacterium]|nr:TraM recognition domain-containing protein [Candidatus Parcubacteria bacterium]